MTFSKRKFCRTGIKNKPPIPRDGETNAAAFPSGPTLETVEVQADGPGSATLTVSFRGSGSLTNYTCETSVDITAWGLEFVEDAGTRYNFSPSLGETGTVKVAAVNLPEGGMPGHHFRIEIVRETAGGGEQHIDWLDMTEGGTHDLTRPADFTAMPPFRWDGVPSQGFGSSAPQAEGRDSFQGVSASAVRALPAVTVGQPVPPPFVTAVATVRRNSDQTVVASARRRVCIPQVVKMQYDQASVNEMLAGYYADNGEVFIQPIPTNSWPAYRAQIAAEAQAYYAEENVNVRFVDSTVSVAQPYTAMQMDGVTLLFTSGGSPITGGVPLPLDVMNADPGQTGTLYYRGFKKALFDFLSDKYILPDPPLPLPLPVTPNEVAKFWARTAAHETGHALGLVAPVLLNGDEGSHNPSPATQLMDSGEESTLHQKMGRDGTVWSFRLWNAEYLRFILPKQ